MKILKALLLPLCLVIQSIAFATENEGIWNSNALAKRHELLRVGVSQEFTNGLHKRYFSYLADKLSLTLDLYVMPLPRRLHELEKGNLDLMIGLIRTTEREQKYVYIEPSYDTLTYRFFTLGSKVSEIKSYEDLYGKVIGIKRASLYYQPFDTDSKIKKVELTSLEQSTRLLISGRVDAFIHNTVTTYSVLNKLDVRHLVKEAHYVPDAVHNRYVVLSKKSHLMKRKQELSHVIKMAVENGDFELIRRKYYKTLE